MKIFVCLANVPDTTTKIRFTDNNSKFDTSGVQWVINPWDELALTRAMELKEDGSNSVDHVTVITVGTALAEPTIRKALAIGADDAIRIDTEPVDSHMVAFQLSEYFKTISEDHIILAGIEASDYNGSAVGGMLSEFLGIPSASAVTGITIEGSAISLKREIDGGIETIEIIPPFVAIVQKGIAIDPRIPAMRGIMMARKKPLNVIAPAHAEALTKMDQFELPQPKPPCKMIDADNAKSLVDLLQNEAKVL